MSGDGNKDIKMKQDLRNMTLDEKLIMLQELEAKESEREVERKIRKLLQQQSSGQDCVIPTTIDELQLNKGYSEIIATSIQHLKVQRAEKYVDPSSPRMTWELVDVLREIQRVAANCMDARKVCSSWLSEFWTEAVLEEGWDLAKDHSDRIVDTEGNIRQAAKHTSQILAGYIRTVVATYMKVNPETMQRLDSSQDACRSWHIVYQDIFVGVTGNNNRYGMRMATALGSEEMRGRKDRSPVHVCDEERYLMVRVEKGLGTYENAVPSRAKTAYFICMRIAEVKGHPCNDRALRICERHGNVYMPRGEMQAWEERLFELNNVYNATSHDARGAIRGKYVSYHEDVHNQDGTGDQRAVVTHTSHNVNDPEATPPMRISQRLVKKAVRQLMTERAAATVIEKKSPKSTASGDDVDGAKRAQMNVTVVENGKGSKIGGSGASNEAMLSDHTNERGDFEKYIYEDVIIDSAANICTTFFLLPSVEVEKRTPVRLMPSGLSSGTVQKQILTVRTEEGNTVKLEFDFYYFATLLKRRRILPVHILRERQCDVILPRIGGEQAHLVMPSKEKVLLKETDDIVLLPLAGGTRGSKKNVVKAQATMLEMHRRLGHSRDVQGIKQYCAEKGIKIVGSADIKCLSCDANNIKQPVRRGKRSHVIDKSLGAWSLDFKPQVLKKGNEYDNPYTGAILLVNNHSHYIHSTTVMSRSLDDLREWFADFKRHFNITSLRGDEEFRSLETWDIFADVDCTWTHGYCAASNGVAEKYIEVIHRKMLTTLHDANMTMRTWDDAWLFACEGWNQVPGKGSHGKAPHAYHPGAMERYGCPAEYMLPYGTLIYMYTAKERRHKRDTTKSHLSVYVGGDRQGFHALSRGNKPRVERSITRVSLTPQEFSVRHPADFEDVKMYFNFAPLHQSQLSRHLDVMSESEDEHEADGDTQMMDTGTGADYTEGTNGSQTWQHGNASRNNDNRTGSNTGSDSDECDTSGSPGRSKRHVRRHVDTTEMKKYLLVTQAEKSEDDVNVTNGLQNARPKTKTKVRGRKAYSMSMERRQGTTKRSQLDTSGNRTLTPGVMVSYAFSQTLDDKESSQRAFMDEMDGLMRTGVFKTVPLDMVKGRKAVRLLGKVVVKRSGKYKGRACADGREVNLDDDIKVMERYAPTAGLEMALLLVSIAKQENLKLGGADVTQAYIQCEMEEGKIVWITMDESIPKAYHPPPGMGHVLARPLYGMPFSGNAWWLHLSKVLEGLGFVPMRSNKSVFVREATDVCGKIIIGTYVDDLIIAYARVEEYEQLITDLRGHFPLTRQDGDTISFLGAEIRNSADGRTVTVDQRALAQRLVDKMRMTHAYTRTAPLPEDSKQCTSGSGEPLDAEKATEYRSAVGMIGYMTFTRPDLLYARHFLARYGRAPRVLHWRMLCHCVRYIKGTINYGLVFKGEKKGHLQVYVDSDHATDMEDGRSVTGRAVFYGGDYVGGEASKQSTTEGSSTGAEIRASAMATRRTIGDQITLSMMGQEVDLPTPILIDNQAAINLYHSPKLGKRVKYLALDILTCRDAEAKGIVKYEKVSSQDNIADMMTKALSGPHLSQLRDRFMVDVDKYHKTPPET